MLYLNPVQQGRVAFYRVDIPSVVMSMSDFVVEDSPSDFEMVDLFSLVKID